MTFPKPPKYSRGQINKAGDALTVDDTNEKNRDVLNEWRVCHGYPINTFQVTLRSKLRKVGILDRSIVAQRLKRAPTIIDKLKRYPTMKLSQMQDIGGLRAVVPTIKNVYDLVEVYRKSRFKHKEIRGKDYVANPRAEDGYRSVHLIYEYNSSSAPEYNGLFLEIQIRTKLQHAWATAVETVGFLIDEALKSRRGNPEWIDFFRIVSAAFAHIEGTALVPGFEHMSRQETFKAVAVAEKNLKALNTMRGFPAAIQMIEKQETRHHYYLISLDLDERVLRIRGFSKDKLQSANAAYAREEKILAVTGQNVELVLVSAGKIKSLRKAYPNFFLDSKDFVEQVEKIIAESEANS